MEMGDGARAWRFLRRNRQYRKAWLRRLPQPGLPEPAPFALRLQTATNLAAARFGLGWRLEGARRESFEFEFRLEGSRFDATNDDRAPEVRIGFRLNVRW